MHLRILTVFSSLPALFGRAMVSIYIGVLAIGLMMSAALAQAGDPSTTLDIGDAVIWTLDILGPWLIPLLAGFAIFLFRQFWVLIGRAMTFLGLKIDERHRATIEQGLVRAVGFAVARFEDRARGGIRIDLQSAAVAEAARYAGKSIPGALKHFGVDVGTEAGRQRLSEMLESRLEGRFFDPADAGASNGARLVSVSNGPVPV